MVKKIGRYQVDVNKRLSGMKATPIMVALPRPAAATNQASTSRSMQDFPLRLLATAT